MEQWHTPVMLAEVMNILDPKPNGRFIDATLGDGGHAAAILERTAPGGTLLGIERDRAMVERARQRLASFGKRCRIVSESYEHIGTIAAREGFWGSDGILFDLGVASYHFDASGRGFSVRRDEPLDMRFDPHTQTLTASDIVNRTPEPVLADIIRRYGEESQAKRIARAIVHHRPIKSTHMLADIIVRAKRGSRHARLHPATRVFQAIRIAVNDELRVLRAALPQAIDVLRYGGILAVLAYHSLEDRAVKQSFQEGMKRGLLALPFRSPLRPSAQEIRANPRCRSARLRAAQRRFQ